MADHQKLTARDLTALGLLSLALTIVASAAGADLAHDALSFITAAFFVTAMTRAHDTRKDRT